MSNQLAPFPSVSKALRALLKTRFAAVGGSLPGELTDLYVRIEMLPGRSNIHEGDFVFDVETFAPSYSAAESAAFAIEALLLGYAGMVEVPGATPVRFDSVASSSTPSETFWDDDTVTRFLATYVITVRR